MLFHWFYRFCVNNTQKQFDKNKVLPHGVPELIHRCMADYRTLDFKVAITHDAINLIHNLYIDCNIHPIFPYFS
ncbi:hypothetical protein EV363DRAFT_1403311 [Boletus edulis]|nr:hypothetical protein EV363DRAFT_1403311 [Boletus edulis]